MLGYRVTLALCMLVGLHTFTYAAAASKSGTCVGNCAAQENNGLANGGKPIDGDSGDSENNGNDNGNCFGNCIGNINGNANGNGNIDSSNNGNHNGNCEGNCFWNVAGNNNGNDNVNVGGNGNRNGICRGNCFYRFAGNSKGNDNVRSKVMSELIKGTAEGQGNDQGNCVGNCFNPQPTGTTSEYDSNYDIVSSPLKCTGPAHGNNFYIVPETFCREIYRATSDGKLTKYVCPAGTVMDLDLCMCNHWYFTDIIETCRSNYQEFHSS